MLEHNCEAAGNSQKHGGVSGKRTADSAIYPQKLCGAMAKGIARQHEKDDEEFEESEGMHGKQSIRKYNWSLGNGIEK